MARLSVVCIGFVLACLIVWNQGIDDVRGDQPGTAIQGFLGPTSCIQCHREPLEIHKREKVTDFVALTESVVWQKNDKHSKAYDLVDPRKSALSRQMCEKLGIDPAKFDSAQQCLSCHSNWIKGSKTPPPYHKLGVGCESCHGASSKWFQPHFLPTWRKKTPEEKAKLGFIDVRNPVARARQCYSCHIGNAKEGKVVTHEMYAAGHPPLPSIELETFSQRMPAHWRYLNAKPEFPFRAEYAKANKLEVYDLYKTRSVTVGSVVALRESIRLVAQQSRDNANWPQLASFDCYACHHDLRYPSWRQTRGYKGKPGRPTILFWPTSLMRLSMDLAAGGKEAESARLRREFDDAMQVIHASLANRPFGDSNLGAACDKVVSWTNGLLKKCQSQKIDQATVKRLLLLLCETHGLADYDSARQKLWAFEQLYSDLKPKPKNDAAIKAWWKKVQATYHLVLPAQDAKILADLPKRLQQLNSYKPERLNSDLAELKKLLQ